jgi:hypothetical protein
MSFTLLSTKGPKSDAGSSTKGWKWGRDCSTTTAAAAAGHFEGGALDRNGQIIVKSDAEIGRWLPTKSTNS